MSITTKQEVLEVLEMSDEEFGATIMPEAEKAYLEQDGRIIVRSMVGYSNRCKNRCLYCGMRALNKELPRYWTSVEDIIAYGRQARDRGFSRIFLVSGEDRKYSVDDICHFISEMHEMGLHISLAAGLFPESAYQEMKAAGLDEYVLKFEMAQPDVFDELNPPVTFAERMAGIEAVKNCGLKLATGDIVGYPGQTLEMLAEDIVLTRDLGASWVPIIPFMPAKNAPLSEKGGLGDLGWLYKTIALLRLMIPGVDITAQQPGQDLRKGLADPESNLKAIKAGANVLFSELLDPEVGKDFGVIDNRNVAGSEHIYKVAELTGMEISF